jgi:TetR/AcrR family transcriptional regulator
MAKGISEKILQATLEIIAREKISGTRMHLIAKEAKMSQSNLHYYYPTKDDLLIALMDDLQNRFSAKRMEAVDLQNKSLDENLHGLFEEKRDDIINHKKVDYAQFDYWVQGTVNPEIRKKFQNTFNEWRNNIKEVLVKGGAEETEGTEGTEEVDSQYSEMLPIIIVSLMMGASMQYLIDEEKFNLEEYFSIAEKMILKFLD